MAPSRYQRGTRRERWRWIVLALTLRAIFIALGAALLDTFSFMFLIFGLALLGTAIQLFRHRDEDPSVQDNALVRAARRALPAADTYHGAQILIQEAGLATKYGGPRRAERKRVGHPGGR